jgi:transposase
MIKKDKRYTYDFQKKAVRLAQLPGKTAQSVAIELGVPSWKLRNWIKQFKDKLERSSDMDELMRLQKENKRLQEEVEILKKPRRTLQRPCSKVCLC